MKSPGISAKTSGSGQKTPSINQTKTAARPGGRVNLLKTGAQGDSVWVKRFGCFGRSVQQTSDGGYVFIADSGDDILLFKTGRSGNLE